MRKELDYYKVGEFDGGNQNWFKDHWMNIGGCGAITAMESCIYFDKKFNENKLCPINPNDVSREDYIKFGMIMKPYLSPRITGIDKLETYIKEFKVYLNEKNSNLQMQEFSGNNSVEEAKKVIINQIDKGYIIPYLNLRHQDKSIEDYEWHWFNLAGYEVKEDSFKVKVMSYGKGLWFDFDNLWDTGNNKKGGMILYSL